MKSVKTARVGGYDAGDTTKRATKLAPNKKSGKERHQLFHSLDFEGDDDELDEPLTHRESILDYIDDGSEEEYDDEFEDDEEFED